jgi:hypothetical protein
MAAVGAGPGFAPPPSCRDVADFAADRYRALPCRNFFPKGQFCVRTATELRERAHEWLDFERS